MTADFGVRYVSGTARRGEGQLDVNLVLREVDAWCDRSLPHNTAVRYQHTQRNGLVPIVLTIAALGSLTLLLRSGRVPLPLGARLTVIAAAVTLAVSGFVFSSLTVVIRDGQLSWWFGPGAIKKTVPLATIVAAEPTTTSAINGLGIHATGRGWLYNVAGRAAVLVRQVGGRQFLIGSDEPERLAEAIRSARDSWGSGLLDA